MFERVNPYGKIDKKQHRTLVLLPTKKFKKRVALFFEVVYNIGRTKQKHTHNLTQKLSTQKKMHLVN